MIRDNECPICGEFFHHLGLASHRARCWERYQEEKKGIEHVVVKDTKCPFCGEMFSYLGIGRHKKACAKRHLND
jgi:hypothetical protein